MSLTTDDLAKFTQLLLQNGEWNGRQILPADYLAEATVKHADNSMNALPDWKLGYGYQFWISQYGYRGDGASGQYIIVIKEYDLCIAVTSCLGNMQSVLSIFWSDLIPNLKESALAEDPESYRELQEFISTLKIQPKVSDIIGTPVNTSFHFQENEAGITSCGVSFGEKCCSLTFQTANGAEQLRAGFGYFEFSTLQLTDVRPHQVAASAHWLSPTVLEIESLICDGIYRDIWTIDFSGKEEPLKNQGLCGCFRPLKPRFLLSR